MNHRSIAEDHAGRLVHTRRDELDARDLQADRIRICARQRGRGAEPGRRITQALARRRVIVFLHRVVLGVRGDQREHRLVPIRVEHGG
ncbi:MAG: hypothetical protein QM736_10955 [Vicinamibacterales bacterium]